MLKLYAVTIALLSSLAIIPVEAHKPKSYEITFYNKLDKKIILKDFSSSCLKIESFGKSITLLPNQKKKFTFENNDSLKHACFIANARTIDFHMNIKEMLELTGEKLVDVPVSMYAGQVDSRQWYGVCNKIVTVYDTTSKLSVKKEFFCHLQYGTLTFMNEYS